MAIIDVDLGSSDEVITGTGGTDVTLVDITALGSHSLTVDGADVEIQSIANVTALSSPSFNAINGGELTVDLGVLDLSALSSFTFGIGDNSTVVLDASAVSTVTTLLNAYNVEFSGSEAGHFVYDPAVSLLSSVVFNVSGMEAGDTFSVSGISNNMTITGYDEAAQTLNLHYGSYTGLLTQSVYVNIEGVTAEEYDAILASLDDSDGGNDLITDDTFTFPSCYPICFTQGTRIATPEGSAAVEALRVGDLVLTRDHGAQPVRWIGSSTVAASRLRLRQDLRPIHIQAGALGDGVPAADLAVSPQHRLLVRSKIAEKMFGAAEVLVAAKKLLPLDGVEVQQDLAEVRYFHILFDRHEVIRANGAEAESLYTGPMALRSVSPAAREEIFALFPELARRDYSPPAARPLISGRPARQLAARHVKNHKALVA